VAELAEHEGNHVHLLNAPRLDLAVAELTPMALLQILLTAEVMRLVLEVAAAVWKLQEGSQAQGLGYSPARMTVKAWLWEGSALSWD